MRRMNSAAAISSTALATNDEIGDISPATSPCSTVRMDRQPGLDISLSHATITDNERPLSFVRLVMSPKRSEEFKADREEEILAAARRCFLAQGYDRTTMREIAAEAGVSTGAIYTYFGTKVEILQALC